MIKTEMADRLAARTGLSKSVARNAVDGVFAIVGEALAEITCVARLQLRGAGTQGALLEDEFVEIR